MSVLIDKTILLGVSGGIACYKSAELVRLLVRAGARVRVAMTDSAREFITPLTMQTLCGAPVATSTFDLTQESEIGHIRLADTADLVIVAPATANVIGKHAAGLADDLLGTILLATRAPLLFAPAMNVHMYEHPAVQENIARLRQRGCGIVEPDAGYLACGYEGPGRLAALERIVAEIERQLSRPDLADDKILVSAGPTREAIDPVRFISNRSSGKMGYALAASAWRRGAEVTLVTGPSDQPRPPGVRCLEVTTAAEMRDAVLAAAAGASLVCMAAAVADYRAASVAASKIKKQRDRWQLDLARTDDILSELGRRKPAGQLLIGFAAETDDVVRNARDKLAAKNVDLMVANDVSRSDSGFDVDTNSVVILDGDGAEEVARAPKTEIADRVWDHVLRRRETPR